MVTGTTTQDFSQGRHMAWKALASGQPLPLHGRMFAWPARA